MKKNYIFYIAVAVLMAAGMMLSGIFYPSVLYSPGDVVKSHSKLKCGDCHTPFNRVSSESCSSARCHETGKISKKLSLNDLHKKIEKQGCLLCHTDHKGTSGHITMAFNHNNLSSKSGCAGCHESEGSEAHNGRYGNQCKACHTTKTWKPSTYDHDRYFPLNKKHKVDCKKCHDTGGYKKYTCMNCHVHATRGIINEHREEGVRNYGDCLRCHRVYMDGRSYGAGRVDDSMIDDDNSDGKFRREGRHKDDDKHRSEKGLFEWFSDDD